MTESLTPLPSSEAATGDPIAEREAFLAESEARELARLIPQASPAGEPRERY